MHTYKPSPMRFVVPTEDDEQRDCIGWLPMHIDKPLSEKGKVVWMSPSRFLSIADRNFRPFKDSPDWLKEQVKAGRCFAPLSVCIDPDLWGDDVRPHEGRHRANLAEQLGVARVPVLVYANNRSGLAEGLKHFGLG